MSLQRKKKFTKLMAPDILLPMKFKERALLVIPNAILLIAFDQWTKYLAVIHLKGSPEISYFGGFFKLMYVTNRGAWGSMGSDWPEPWRKIVLIVIPVLFILGLSFYIFSPKTKLKKIELIAFGFIIAGGVGNMIDRIHADAVIDMLWMGISHQRYLQTNVFNIADVAIMIGFFMMIGDFIALKLPKRKAS
jgi:signal peptidase II